MREDYLFRRNSRAFFMAWRDVNGALNDEPEDR
jgi:hypothetical protein